jgi:hypothetical protein
MVNLYSKPKVIVPYVPVYHVIWCINIYRLLHAYFYKLIIFFILLFTTHFHNNQKCISCKL